MEPKQTASFVVEESRPVQTTYRVADIIAEQVVAFASRGLLDQAAEAALRKIIAQKEVLHAIHEKAQAREQESEAIFDDQERLHETMKALAEERALVQRHTQRLNEQESRLEALKKERAELEAEAARARNVLDGMIQELAFEIKL